VGTYIVKSRYPQIAWFMHTYPLLTLLVERNIIYVTTYIFMSIGQRIRSIREGKGLKQTEVAERSGMQQGTYSQLENDLFEARPETLEKVGQALGLTTSEMEDLMIESKLRELKMLDPDFVMMLKDVRNMTTVEKQSIMDAYELVKLKRERNK